MKLTPITRLFKLLDSERKEVIYVYLYAIFGGLLSLVLPLGIQAVIGLVQGGDISSSLIILIAVVTVGTLFAGFLQIMQITLTETIQRRVFSRSAFDFALRIPRLRTEAIQRDYPPELVNRFFDTMNVQKSLPKVLIDFSTGVIQIIFGLILISFYHPFFIFFSIAVLFLLGVIMRFTGPEGMDTSLQESKYKYKVAHWLQEVARTLVTFKLASGARLSISKTNDLVNNYLAARGAHFRVLVKQYAYVIGFRTLITAVLLALGGILVIQNQITVGQFVAAEIVVLLIISSVEKVIVTLETVYDLLTGLEKIGYFTDLPLDSEEGMDFKTVDTGEAMELTLNQVHYKFSDADQPTLDNLSLSLRPGEKVCIAGYNRAGKSTLIQAVAGLITDYQGTISYNGAPVNNFNIISLRRYIGDHGSQEDIFEGTLWENICLGHREITFPQIVWAIRQVGLEEFVQSLPKGYDTILVPGGKNLPQSVQTKILLARTIVSQPRLLAMEEFLHKLQPEHRERMANMLTARQQKWTLLAVSNDPLLAARCERILIMRKGRIVADGTYDSLQKNPHFQHIFGAKTNGKSILPEWSNDQMSPAFHAQNQNGHA